MSETCSEKTKRTMAASQKYRVTHFDRTGKRHVSNMTELQLKKYRIARETIISNTKLDK